MLCVTCHGGVRVPVPRLLRLKSSIIPIVSYIKRGLNFGLLDSRRGLVGTPGTKGAGASSKTSSRIQMLRHFDIICDWYGMV